MKLLLLPVLMAFVAVAQVFCENDPKEDVDYWTNSNQIQVLYYFIFYYKTCHFLLIILSSVGIDTAFFFLEWNLYTFSATLISFYQNKSIVVSSCDKTESIFF